RCAVIGSGFIGTEVAAVLAMNGKKVTLIFPDDYIGSRMYPAELAKYLNDYYREKGVEVLSASKVVGCEIRQGKSILKIQGAEREGIVDGVGAGIGVEAQRAGGEGGGLAGGKGIPGGAWVGTRQGGSYSAV